MNDQILDEDFNPKDPRKEKNLGLHALVAVITMAIVYLVIYLMFIDGLEYDNRIIKAVVEDFSSILHFIMAMIFLNYSVTEGDYKLNVKGGYYILLLGSGFFLVGALSSLFKGIIDSLALEHTLIRFWELNYQDLITLSVILTKLILIRPIAFLLEKTKRK